MAIIVFHYVQLCSLYSAFFSFTFALKLPCYGVCTRIANYHLIFRHYFQETVKIFLPILFNRPSNWYGFVNFTFILSHHFLALIFLSSICMSYKQRNTPCFHCMSMFDPFDVFHEINNWALSQINVLRKLKHAMIT